MPGGYVVRDANDQAIAASNSTRFTNPAHTQDTLSRRRPKNSIRSSLLLQPTAASVIREVSIASSKIESSR